MISRTSTSSGLSSLVGFLRPTSHGGRAVANASVRSLELARKGREARTCAAGAVRIITSVDGRITSSVYLIIVKVDARSVAGKWRTRGWTGRSPSRTDCDVPYSCKKGLSMASFLFMPALN